MSPTRTPNPKKRYSIGHAVFYPHLPQSLPPPLRRSSGSPGAKGFVSPTPPPKARIPPLASSNRGSPTGQSRGDLLSTVPLLESLSTIDTASPYEHATEYPFPSFTSPPSTVDPWAIFTPYSTNSNLENSPYGVGSEPDLALLSPDSTNIGPHDLDPDSTKPLFTTSILQPPAPRSFFFGSPVESPGPVPLRQSAFVEPSRRASAPHVPESPIISNGLYHPFVANLPPAHEPSTSHPPYRPQPVHDLFSPTYSIGTSPRGYTPPSTNFLALEFDQGEYEDYEDAEEEAEEEPSHVSVTVPVPAPPPPNTSQVANFHLKDHILDYNFSLRYAIVDELGAGGFGFVCSAVQTGWGKDVAGLEVAVKFIFKDRVEEEEGAMINGEPAECFVLRRCSHRNIIGFVADYEDDKFYYLVQELHGDPWHPGHTLEKPPSPPPILPLTACDTPSTPAPSPPPYGRPLMPRRASYDLFEAVEHRRFTEDQAKWIFRQIVEGVAYMHGRGIYHRDLKDENIVIDRNLNVSWTGTLQAVPQLRARQVKIIDFGSAVMESKFEPTVYHEHFRGTLTYAASGEYLCQQKRLNTPDAPAEILHLQSYAAGPADIWALGILLCVILTGESPFPDPSWAKEGRMRFKRVERVTPGAMSLILRCLNPNPGRRANITEVRYHWWFTEGMHRGSI
ncbi:hypothetical protein P7C73_g1891, partial [Tremellales sp. Uapishka_1]